MEKRNIAKKRNFSELEIGTLTSEVEVNKYVLFGSLKTGIKELIKTLSGRRSRRQSTASPLTNGLRLRLE